MEEYIEEEEQGGKEKRANLKILLTTSLIPFSERKGYTAFKYLG